MIIQATDLPALRREIVDFGFGVIAQEWGMAEHIAAAAAEAELFFVAEPMVDLALAAKDSLIDFRVEPEDMPSKYGLVYFAKPFCSYQYKGVDSVVTGAVWRHRGDGLDVAWLIDRDHFADGGGFARAGVFPWRSEIPHLLPIECHDWQWEQQEGSVVEPWARLFMKSVWLLMQQTVASIRQAEFKRHDRRRLERRKIEPAAVRVITLRRPKAEDGHRESDREYHHQWIVRGHWRQQWYPTRGVHRPAWIAPHIKGPEGAPLLGGEKVHAWVR